MSVITASAFLAFSIALPFGPVSLMCVQRSLAGGALHGLACGVGASTAHAVFAVLAVVGADAAAQFLHGYQPLVHVASAATLIAIGIRMMTRSLTPPRVVAASEGGLTDYMGCLTLALTNPATVLPYLALAGSGGFVEGGRFFGLAATVLGVLLGSVAWYATLSSSAWALRTRLPDIFLSRLHLIAGVALIGMALRLVV